MDLDTQRSMSAHTGAAGGARGSVEGTRLDQRTQLQRFHQPLGSRVTGRHRRRRLPLGSARTRATLDQRHRLPQHLPGDAPTHRTHVVELVPIDNTRSRR